MCVCVCVCVFGLLLRFMFFLANVMVENLQRGGPALKFP